LSTPQGIADRGAGWRAALVLATLLALVPWAGLAADALSGPGTPPGTPTTTTCDGALCFSSLDNVVLTDTLLPAALCAAAAAALAAAVLVRRQGRWWPAAVIALAAVAMMLYAVYA
jgi:hypothetical protein